MQDNEGLHFSLSVITYPLLIVFSLWVVFWFEVRFGVNLNRYGVYPQKIEGLKGVLFSPFIHSGLKHLFNNSIPLLVLSTALFYFYRHLKWKVLVVGLLATGLLTWVIGRPSYHIGASGIVYMLTSFLFFKGILSRHYRLIALSLVVVFLYGGLVWYLFPGVEDNISWEGHLSGFIVGAILSIIFKKNVVKSKKYEWERADYNSENDPFMQQFDEDGNFIEIPKVKTDNTSEIAEDVTDSQNKVVYHFKIGSNKDISEEKDD